MVIKKGRLSVEDEAFIMANATRLSVKDIATQINRSPEGVKKACVRLGLDYEQRDSEVGLINKKFYMQIKTQFREHELVHFANQWDAMKNQFGEDVLYTEENQIVDTITMDILISRELTTQALTESRMEDIFKELKTCTDGEEKMALRDELAALRASQGDHLKNYNNLIDKKMKSLAQLKATRQQRDVRLSSKNLNFNDKLREIIDNDELREVLGKRVAKYIIAMEQERLKLAEWHEYEDGTVDQPLLNCDTVLEEEK